MPFAGLDGAEVQAVGVWVGLRVGVAQHTVEQLVVDHISLQPSRSLRMERKQLAQSNLLRELHLFQIDPQRKCIPLPKGPPYILLPRLHNHIILPMEIHNILGLSIPHNLILIDDLH